MFLARSADQIAEATGFSRLLVGSLILAAATLLPEFPVNLTASRAGQPDLAVGDLCGDCRMNSLAPLVLNLMHHSAGSMVSRQSQDPSWQVSPPPSHGRVAVRRHSEGLLCWRLGMCSGDGTRADRLAGPAHFHS